MFSTCNPESEHTSQGICWIFLITTWRGVWPATFINPELSKYIVTNLVDGISEGAFLFQGWICRLFRICDQPDSICRPSNILYISHGQCPRPCQLEHNLAFSFSSTVHKGRWGCDPSSYRPRIADIFQLFVSRWSHRHLHEMVWARQCAR